MEIVRLEAPDDFDGWRNAARNLAARGIPPDDIIWQVEGEPEDLFATPETSPAPAKTPAALNVPRPFLTLARQAILHSDPERFARLYTLLLRVARNPGLMQDHADRHVHHLEDLAHAVRRDIHKMRAFLRFRAIPEPDGAKDRARFVAWFEPEHHILRANAAFFVDRFTTMTWSILTPRGTLHWDEHTLTEGPPATRADAAGDDGVEDIWKAYYSAIFNPARLMSRAMLKEMPRKYWKNMPETALIPGLVAGARKRETAMIDHARSGPAKPATAHTLSLLRDEASTCRRCPLWQPATQTVFGEGPPDAAIMIVGEQPGDQEDLAGRAFVGPAGQMFDRALAAAGIDRTTLYITNAVKHFKFEPRGKRRIHARPNVTEIDACRWWIDQERDIIRPRLVIAMGATAARSLTGKTIAIKANRQTPLHLPDGTPCHITIHPSYLLRLPEADAQAEFQAFVADLKRAAASLSPHDAS